MENKFSTTLNQYTYTLPNGNTIITTGETEDLARQQAEDQFSRFKAQGSFEGLTVQDLGTPVAKRADAEAYIIRGLDVPVGTNITQNLEQRSEELERQGYSIEGGRVSRVPPSADPAFKEAFTKKVLDHIVGNAKISEDQLSIYDLNSDGEISINDVTSALRAFKNLGAEEQRSKVQSAFNTFVETTPELSSKAFVEKILGHIVGKTELTAEEQSQYDFNKDGKIDLSDSLAVQKHNAGLNVDENIGSAISSFHRANVGLEETVVDSPISSTTPEEESDPFTPMPVVEPDPEIVDDLEDTGDSTLVDQLEPYEEEDKEDKEDEPLDLFDVLDNTKPDKPEPEREKFYYVLRNSKEIRIAESREAAPKSIAFGSNDKNEVLEWIVKNFIEDTAPVDIAPEPIDPPEAIPEPDPTPTPTPTPVSTPTGEGAYSIGNTPFIASTVPSYTPVQQYQPNTSAGMTFAPAQQATTFQAQAVQPQFMGPTNPATGTFVLGQPQQFTTGVMGTTSSLNPTYGSSYFMNEGGVVPQQQIRQQQNMFGGFKPEAMQRIAGSLGYQGDMSGFNNYLNNNPDKKQKMDMFNQKAMQMVNGGMVQKYSNGGQTTRVLSQPYVPQQQQPASGTGLEDVMANQAINPALPTGTTVTPVGTVATADQMVGAMDPTAGMVYGTAAVPTALASTTQAGMPVATGANLMTPSTAAADVDKLMEGVDAAQLDSAPTIDAAQGSSSLKVNAAQGTATMMENPVTREIQEGELISGAADAQKAAKFTEQIQAATAEPSEKATVQGQLAGLMQQFEGGDTPAWAAGAMRAAMGTMAARGLGASSLAGQAAVQAAMESALPIASADAATQAQFEQQNLSNRQQRAMLAAQQRAQFMGQEFDQAFQARVANASKISDVANMNFTAEQQVALENSRAANTMNMANLSNRQAGIMAEAAAIANMDMANLNNRQQAAVMNAQNFLQVDMANLNNRQQSELFRAQQRTQALFTDQAAENAAAQFNASSQNQVDQFFASLANNTAQFNASQANAQAQFNAGQTNVVERFNTEINNQREQFNANNRLVIDQSNAQWRRQIATADTAAINRANEINAASLLGYSTTAYNNLWQYYSDNMSWAWTSAENDRSRYHDLALEELRNDNAVDLSKLKEDYATSEAFGSLIATLFTANLTDSIAGKIFGGFF